MTKPHPIFQKFNGFVGRRPAGEVVDWIGCRFEGIWDSQHDIPEFETYSAALPNFDEEYFEWIDLLETVDSASGPDPLVIMELGAGYGRWGVRTAQAARQRGLAVDLHFAEAEPQHAAWLRDSIDLNGLSACSTVHEFAIAYGTDSVAFTVHADELNAHNWYGQSVMETTGEKGEGEYFGKQLYRHAYGYSQIMVEARPLETITDSLDRVDLIDMDLQGAEMDLIKNSMDTLNAKVKRVHIGTHGADIEAYLRETFTKHGWTNRWDFPCHTKNDTPFGKLDFVDGVQSWINPKL